MGASDRFVDMYCTPIEASEGKGCLRPYGGMSESEPISVLFSPALDANKLIFKDIERNSSKGLVALEILKFREHFPHSFVIVVVVVVELEARMTSDSESILTVTTPVTFRRHVTCTCLKLSSSSCYKVIRTSCRPHVLLSRLRYIIVTPFSHFRPISWIPSSLTFSPSTCLATTIVKL